jgi:hypothetical protein
VHAVLGHQRHPVAALDAERGEGRGQSADPLGERGARDWRPGAVDLVQELVRLVAARDVEEQLGEGADGAES